MSQGESERPDGQRLEVVGSVTPAKRPDRVGTVAMTARVPPRLRRIYSVIAAELGVPKNELHVVALRALLLHLRVRSELQEQWEKLLSELGESS
jgi:hypothetical protein